jgi:hypothetical protein
MLLYYSVLQFNYWSEKEDERLIFLDLIIILFIIVFMPMVTIIN